MRHRQGKKIVRILGPKTCAVETCSIVIASRFLMCLEHWHRVPQGLRLRIWAALSQWQNDALGNLWEFRPIEGIEMAYLLWSPAGPVIGSNCHGRRKTIEERLGPMIGAA